MNTYKLLWTSGFDSTYRLIEIILVENKKAQPIYIIDEQRTSYLNELRAIEKILALIQRLHPLSYQNILPLIKVNKKDIEIDKEILQSYNKIRERTTIGTQYLWLASYCKKNQLKEIEICIVKRDTLESLIENTYSKSKSHWSDFENSTYEIFQFFKFPVITMTKKEMYNQAKQKNWTTILNHSWFCHNSKKNNPCGKCKPCLTVIESGLGFRIKPFQRLKGYLKMFKNRIKKPKLNWFGKLN